MEKSISENSIRRTISVCTLEHLDVWRVASRYIMQNIEADEYLVIVPDFVVPNFVKVTPKRIAVVAESSYSKHFESLLKSVFPEAYRLRYGWYLQQFLKLLAICENKQGVSLIWDADTVPLRRLQFIKEGSIGYYTGTEYHRPYFHQIHSVTGLSKIVKFSFIAQCFAIKAEWFAEFIRFIQERSEKPWLEALIRSIDYSEKSGFSEYELLGTFLVHKHKDQMHRISREWYRRGNSLIGGIENIRNPKFKDVLGRFDYMSFESWDKPRASHVHVESDGGSQIG